MANPDDASLDALEALLAKARPLPYIADLHNEKRDGGRFSCFIAAQNDPVPIACVPTGVDGYGREEGRATAELLVAAVNALPGLLATIRDLRKRDGDGVAGERIARDEAGSST